MTWRGRTLLSQAWTSEHTESHSSLSGQFCHWWPRHPGQTHESSILRASNHAWTELNSVSTENIRKLDREAPHKTWHNGFLRLRVLHTSKPHIIYSEANWTLPNRDFGKSEHFNLNVFLTSAQLWYAAFSEQISTTCETLAIMATPLNLLHMCAWQRRQPLVADIRSLHAMVKSFELAWLR